MTTHSVPQGYYAYTEEGSRFSLAVLDSVVSVKLVDARGSFMGLYQSEAGLDSNIAPLPICEGFSLLHVTTGYDPVALVERLRNHSEVLFANLSFHDTYGNPVHLTESFIANFYASVPQAAIDSMNSAHGVVVLDSLFDDPYWLLLKVTANSDLDVLTMGNSYHESNLVRYAKAGMVLNLQADVIPYPDDSLWDRQWHFRNFGQTGGATGADINLTPTFNLLTAPPSRYVTVAILDDGFAPHEDFPASRIIGGYDYLDNDFNFSPDPTNFHGMGVMGIIGAETTLDTEFVARTGITGINDHTKIIGQKISNSAGAFATDVRIAQAFSDAVAGGARVINCSWSCKNCTDSMYPNTTSWIRKTDSAGVVVVASAGNHGQLQAGVGWPAKMPEVIAVGATDSLDGRWFYSAYGPELDVMASSGKTGGAKGDDSTIAGRFWTLDQMGSAGRNNGTWPCDGGSNSNYNCAFGGTSAAAAEVSGIVSLILLQRPDLMGHTEQIRQIIRHSSKRTQYGKPPGDTSRVSDYLGWGRVDAAQALIAVMCTACGDADGNGVINTSDFVFLIGFVYNGTPIPGDCNYQYGLGDADGNGVVNISDIIALINYVFDSTPVPHCYGM